MELSTRDPEVARAALKQINGGESPLRISGDTREFSCSLRLATAGELGADRIRHTTVADAAMAPLGFFLAVCIVGRSSFRLTVGRETSRLRPGDVVSCGRGDGLEASWHDVHTQTLRVPFETLDRIARERFGARAPVQLSGMRPVSAGAARNWRRLQAYVLSEIDAPESLFNHPLIQRQITDLVGGTALVTFPNSTMRANADDRRRRLARASSLRRAVAFIEDNPGVPVTISEIAEAAGVTTRALQYGFARHLDTTPMAYLRRVRLERAHQELLAADPASGATISNIARRWGFTNPSRFAAYYRGVYGCPPGGTLRR